MNFESSLRALLRVLSTVEAEETQGLVTSLLEARCVHVAGTGRNRFILEGFAMRLTQLGLKAFPVGGASTPAFGTGDLLLLCSAAAQSQRLQAFARQASAAGGRSVLVTSAVISPLCTLVESRVFLPPLLPGEEPDGPAEGKLLRLDDAKVLDPARTLFEQALFLFLDDVASRILSCTGQDASTLEERRPNLD